MEVRWYEKLLSISNQGKKKKKLKRLLKWYDNDSILIQIVIFINYTEIISFSL